MSHRLHAFLRLRYYRYEVTMGLYMMTSGEKVVLNGFFLTILGLLLYTLYCGLLGFAKRARESEIHYFAGNRGQNFM